MTFRFVDRILEWESGKHAVGIKNVSRMESFFYWLPDGRRGLSPAIVSEALAQLGGWLIMASTDFTKRGVPILDESSVYQGFVTSDAVVDLRVEILELNDDTVMSRGEAFVDGQSIVASSCCRGYLLPIDEFSDPLQSRREFQSLLSPKGRPDALLNRTPLRPHCGVGVMDGQAFLDGLLHHSPYEKVAAIKNVTSCETYFDHHFPRKPVVPGVMLMTFMGETCQHLLHEDPFGSLRSRALLPTFVKNVRFRKFVEPGDQLIMKAEVKSGDARRNGEDIVIQASMHANEARVMQAEMGFRTLGH